MLKIEKKKENKPNSTWCFTRLTPTHVHTALNELKLKSSFNGDFTLEMTQAEITKGRVNNSRFHIDAELWLHQIKKEDVEQPADRSEQNSCREGCIRGGGG